MRYELWDRRQPRRLGIFDTEAEALRAVRSYIDALGRSSLDVMALELLEMAGSYRGRSLLAGPQLGDRALRGAPATGSEPS